MTMIDPFGRRISYLRLSLATNGLFAIAARGAAPAVARTMSLTGS